MEPSTSGVIPEKNLKTWKVFRDVGADGDKILKTAKFAYAAYSDRGFVVTMTDETYLFQADTFNKNCKISKIEELSGIGVKEFFTGIEHVDLAITEDGRLFSWLNGRIGYSESLSSQLGRYISGSAAEKEVLCYRPALVTAGSLTGVKVRQVVSSKLGPLRILALSVGGDVHVSVSRGSVNDPWIPSLIPREHFDHQEVISVATCWRTCVALTAKGELFQWELGVNLPQKVLTTKSVSFEKITGTSNFVFALNVKGELYYLTANLPSDDNRMVTLKTVFEDHKIEDIASCREHHVVVELKNNTRVAFSYSEEQAIPSFTFPSSASVDVLLSQLCFDFCTRTISAKIEPPPRPRVRDDIRNLWESKEHADVTFSVEGEVIPAHKFLLAGRSEYFERMFSKEWNEARGPSSVVEVKDTTHAIFDALLFYFYTDEVKFEEDEYENIFDLMKLAGSYCQLNLRHECEKILMSNINSKNAFFLARNAASANASTLGEKVIKLIVDNHLLADLMGIDAYQKISVQVTTELPAPSTGVIPKEKLKIWEIFRCLEADGEEILKTARLAHVAFDLHGFVVTLKDDTYSFSGDRAGGRKICKIPELSGIRVKEFFTGAGPLNFAITEDARLFSWSNELESELKYDQSLANKLGRYVPCAAEDKMDLFHRPAPVTDGSLTGVKVRQVVVAGRKGMYTVALSVDGKVHQWGSENSRNTHDGAWRPSLIPRERFNQQVVISVASSNCTGVALTAKGELFQWKLGNKQPQKVVDVGPDPFKKITGNCHIIFALTVKGRMFYLDLAARSRRPCENVEWTTAFLEHKIEDIASCDENVVVVELKNHKRFAFSSGRCFYSSRIPAFTLQSSASVDEHFAKMASDTCYRTISAQVEPPPRRRVGDDIITLWENKRLSDVTFSVEGEVIPAHKFLLAGRSEYFERMFSKEWNEARGPSSVVEVKDTTHDIFEALLFYFYSDEVKFEEHEYENIFELMKLADSYCLINLRHECEKILLSNINSENAFFLARNASSANASTLEEKVIKFIVRNRLLVDMVGMDDAFQKITTAATLHH